MAKRILSGIAAVVLLILCMMFEKNTIRETMSDVERCKTEQKKTAYITFDDGPSCLTKQYLDILEREGVKATFFVIGSQITEDMENIIKREIEDGHEIGIHTYTHDAGKMYSCKEKCMEEIEKTGYMLEEKFGYKAKVMRFPWGSSNNYVKNFKSQVVNDLKKQGLEYADWNVSAEDSVGCPTVDSIMKNIKKDCYKYNEPVILMHDSCVNKKTLESLEKVINELKSNGYGFDVLSNRKESCHFCGD
ncbi:MAG: polysaccharide deacetylase [Lachnospiraceae bacterium]|nr:polysaccharide deacetylase [Lachnospiraceae bacterium]